MPLGALPSRTRLITRNRLIAALSVATVVVEAGPRSGALRVADAAAAAAPVMAVPGSVTSHQSQGCHQLIRDGALLVTRTEEVAGSLDPAIAEVVGSTPDPVAVPT